MDLDYSKIIKSFHPAIYKFTRRYPEFFREDLWQAGEIAVWEGVERYGEDGSSRILARIYGAIIDESRRLFQFTRYEYRKGIREQQVDIDGLDFIDMGDMSQSVEYIQLQKNYEGLSERDKVLLDEYLCEGSTMEEMGKRRKITMSRVSQLYKQAKSQLMEGIC